MADEKEGRGSENVFRDLELPADDELLEKAVEVMLLQSEIDVRGLSPDQAAVLCDVPMSSIENVEKCKLEDLSSSDLNAAKERLEGIKEETLEKLKRLIDEGIEATRVGDYSIPTVREMVEDETRRGDHWGDD